MTETIQPTLKAFLVDDERKAISNLSNLIDIYCQNIEVIGCSQNPLHAASAIREEKPDILFLDIEMPKLNGLELLKLIEDIDLYVVFVTAYDQYAIQAIKSQALDYLLKPISIDELQQVGEKILKLRTRQNNDNFPVSMEASLKKLLNSLGYNHKIIFSLEEGHIVEETSNILYLESENNYTYVYRKEGKRLLVAKSLKYFENQLRDNQFVRIHNSYLVNLQLIEKFIKKNGGYVVMENGKKIAVSRRKMHSFEDRFNVQFKRL